jgi:DNA polymerase-3 subunit epsilon
VSAATARWWQGPMCPFDTESTGVDLENDRIVSATVVVMRPTPGGRHEVDVRSHLIAVDVDIPAEATAVHQITTEYAREHGKPAADVLDLVAADLAMALRAGVPTVGMNLAFDWTLLDRECRRWDVPTVDDRLDGQPIAPVVDIYVIDRALDRYRSGSRKLTDLCGHYGVRLDGAHDATFDALGAARVAYRMGQRSQMTAEALRALYTDRRYPDRIAAGWQQFGRLSLAELHAQQVRWYREQTVGLGQHWQQKYNEARHAAEVAHEQGADETAAIAEQEAAELAARIDSLSPHWPIRPYIEQGVNSS